MEMQKPNVSVMPTARDYLLLKGLYDFKVMSFPQIARMHFVGKAKPTIVNRLSKLESTGLIARFKVPRLIQHESKNVISVVYQITRAGIRVLQKWHQDVEFWPEPLRLQPFSIDHDLLLVDVLVALKKQNTYSELVLAEHFCREANTQGLKPDAVLFKDNDKRPVALELELTAKSEKRYRELILKYRLTKDFDQVLYVTGHPAIEAKVKAVIGPSNSNDRFKFISVKDILSRNERQNISNLGTKAPEERVGANDE